MIVEPSPDLILALFATVNVFDKHIIIAASKKEL